MKCFSFSEILLGYLRFLFHSELPYFSIPNVRFGKIQNFFKVFKTNFEIQYFSNTFNIAWEPCVMNTSTQAVFQTHFLKKSDVISVTLENL